MIKNSYESKFSNSPSKQSTKMNMYDNEEIALFEVIEASELSTLSTLFASGCHQGISSSN